MKKMFLVLLIFLILIGSFFLFFQDTKEKYSVSEKGIISYTNRQSVKYEKVSRILENENKTTDKFYFESHGVNVYGLLTIPKTVESDSSMKKPVFIVLPGAGGTKEGEERGISKDLNEFGFATFSLDPRGSGETVDRVTSFEEDFVSFSNKQEPFQQKMIYDVVRAFDFLKTRPEINTEKIYVAGESMGGRLAIIAAAIEPKIKGILAVSTSGYKFPKQQTETANIFLSSFDPDLYIGKISPKVILMIHSTNDTVIPIDFAKDTFSKAGEPKKFIEVNGTHGYTPDSTKEILRKELDSWK